MKTITKSEQLLELSEGAVILTSDGIPAQLVMNQTTYRRDGGGRYHWQRTDGTYLTHTFSALLPATLIYPLVFDAADVDRAAKALRDDKANRAEYYHVPEWADTPYGDKLVYRSAARAVLGAVGRVEA